MAGFIVFCAFALFSFCVFAVIVGAVKRAQTEMKKRKLKHYAYDQISADIIVKQEKVKVKINSAEPEEDDEDDS